MKGAFNRFVATFGPDLNSGAIDIIVIQWPNHTLHTSPWHVRFPKPRLLKKSERIIKIYINEQEIDFIQMQIGDAGEAYFILEEDGQNLSVEGMQSGCASPREWKWGGLPKRGGQSVGSDQNYDSNEDSGSPIKENEIIDKQNLEESEKQEEEHDEDEVDMSLSANEIQQENYVFNFEMMEIFNKNKVQ